MLLNRTDRALWWQQLSQTTDVEMIQKGQVAIFKMVQAESFYREIKHLMSKKGMVPNYSSISQLDSFLKKDNIIRVGGRLRTSSLTEAEQHPVILPKRAQSLMQSSNGATFVSHNVQEDWLWITWGIMVFG